jgi:hypothetical protein
MEDEQSMTDDERILNLKNTIKGLENVNLIELTVSVEILITDSEDQNTT